MDSFGSDVWHISNDEILKRWTFDFFFWPVTFVDSSIYCADAYTFKLVFVTLHFCNTLYCTGMRELLGSLTKCKKCLGVVNKLIHTVPVIYDYKVRKGSRNLSCRLYLCLVIIWRFVQCEIVMLVGHVIVICRNSNPRSFRLCYLEFCYTVCNWQHVTHSTYTFLWLRTF